MAANKNERGNAILVNVVIGLIDSNCLATITNMINKIDQMITRFIGLCIKLVKEVHLRHTPMDKSIMTILLFNH